MKVLLYSQNQKQMKKSGIGHALGLQKKALESQGINVTFDPKDDFDICHINTLFLKSYRFMRKLQKKGIPVVCHGHSTKEDFLNSFRASNQIAFWFNHNLMRMYSQATHIITPTIYSKKLIEAYQIKAKIFALSNGIDLAEYTEDTNISPEDLKDFYNFLGINETDNFVIGMGFYFVRKGLVDFIEVAKKFPNIKFIWFGQRYKFITSTPILRAIKNKPANVILPGYIGKKYKDIAFKYAKLFFFPSYEETEGIVTLEALAKKIPLLVRNIPVYDPWLKKDYNVLMGDNNEDFVREIKKVLEKRPDAIIDQGFEVVKERDITIVGRKLKEIYQEVIDYYQNKNLIHEHNEK